MLSTRSCRPRLEMLFLTLVLAFSPSAVFGQANEVVDRLLEESRAHFVDAARLILMSADKVGETAGPDEVRANLPSGLLPAGAELPETITLGQVCFLIMSTQNLTGGWAYQLFPGPRNATRELDARRLLRGRPYPDRVVSGEEVLWVLGAVTNDYPRAP